MSPPASRAREAEGALAAFARGELPWGERPEAAPAGRGVRVLAIDSGASSGHDHVGQGKVVTAVVRHVAPAAEVFAVNILGRGITTTVDVLQGALEFALRSRARVVNLSAAIAADDRGRVRALCRDALRSGILIVASARSGSPAELPEVIGAAADARLGERSLRYVRGATMECRAAGWPCPVPERPRERSPAADRFAAARVAGAVACILEARPRADLAAVRDELEAHFST